MPGTIVTEKKRELAAMGVDAVIAYIGRLIGNIVIRR